MNFGYVFAFLAAITWGITYTLDQKILEKVSPLTLNSMYYFVSFMLTLPFLVYKKKELSIVFTNDKRFIYFLLANFTLAFLANYFITSGIKNLDASTASIIEITYPIFVIIFSIFVFKTMPNYLFFIGSAIVLLGIVLIIKSTN
jgi:drug/metabolite transporter (DMT)-like permease